MFVSFFLWIEQCQSGMGSSECIFVLSSDNTRQRHYPLIPLGLVVSELAVVEGECGERRRKRMIIEIGW